MSLSTRKISKLVGIHRTTLLKYIRARLVNPPQRRHNPISFGDHDRYIWEEEDIVAIKAALHFNKLKKKPHWRKNPDRIKAATVRRSERTRLQRIWSDVQWWKKNRDQHSLKNHTTWEIVYNRLLKVGLIVQQSGIFDLMEYGKLKAAIDALSSVGRSAITNNPHKPSETAAADTAATTAEISHTSDNV